MDEACLHCCRFAIRGAPVARAWSDTREVGRRGHCDSLALGRWSKSRPRRWRRGIGSAGMVASYLASDLGFCHRSFLALLAVLSIVDISIGRAALTHTLVVNLALLPLCLFGAIAYFNSSVRLASRARHLA